MRSTTLIPVSNISRWVDCSVRAGAGRWMGWRFSAFTGPSSSTGSPITLSTRPRVAGPTGTMMGPPVSVAFIPRTMPSVGSMETQRARFSPMCCSTSAITSMAMPLPLPSSWMRTALWMGGMAWSNSTSTTGPMICTTRPTFSLAASFPAFVIDPPPYRDRSSTPHPIPPPVGGGERRTSVCSARSSGGGARSRDDLDDLLGDRGLPDLVHVEGQAVDHVARIVRGRVHGGHPRGVLRGRRFEQRVPDVGLHVLGEDPREDGPGARLVEVVEPRLLLTDLPPLHGQQALHRHPLLDHALELVVDQVDLVEVPLDEVVHDAPGDPLGVGVAQGLEDAHLLPAHPELAPAEIVAPLAAEEGQAQVLSLVLAQEARRGADDVGVETPAEPLVRGDHEEHDALAPAVQEEGVGARIGAGSQIPQHLEHLPGVGPGREHGLLGAAQLGRGDHLHGLRDLLRALDAADPPADVDEGGHLSSGRAVVRRPGRRPGRRCRTPRARP